MKRVLELLPICMVCGIIIGLVFWVPVYLISLFI